MWRDASPFAHQMRAPGQRPSSRRPLALGCLDVYTPAGASSRSMPDLTVRSRQITIGDLTFNCREAGDGHRLVMLLHGFPETSHMWTGVLSALARAGYRAVAPDQRGYSPGARPAEIEAYAYRYLAEDVVALAHALGHAQFDLVGHDWGAIVGWSVLASRPDVVRTWTSLSIPHYAAFAQAVLEDDNPVYEKTLALFLAPEHAAERVLSRDDFRRLRTIWTDSDEAEVMAYLDVLGQPGALTGALNYYRACRGHARALDDSEFVFGPVQVPTRLLWGRHDPYVLEAAVDRAREWMRGPYEVAKLDAGHWLVQQRGDEVTRAICDQLARG